MNFPLVKFSCEYDEDYRCFSCLLCEIDPYRVLVEIGAEDIVLPKDGEVMHLDPENNCRLVLNGTRPGLVVIETEEPLTMAIVNAHLTKEPRNISEILRAIRNMSMDYFCMLPMDCDIQPFLSNPYLAGRLNELTADITYSRIVIEDNSCGELEISLSWSNSQTYPLERKIVPIQPGILITADILINCLLEQRIYQVKINRVGNSRTEITPSGKNLRNFLKVLRSCLNKYLVNAKPCTAKSACSVVL